MNTRKTDVVVKCINSLKFIAYDLRNGNIICTAFSENEASIKALSIIGNNRKHPPLE